MIAVVNEIRRVTISTSIGEIFDPRNLIAADAVSHRVQLCRCQSSRRRFYLGLLGKGLLGDGRPPSFGPHSRWHRQGYYSGGVGVSDGKESEHSMPLRQELPFLQFLLVCQSSALSRASDSTGPMALPSWVPSIGPFEVLYRLRLSGSRRGFFEFPEAG